MTTRSTTTTKLRRAQAREQKVQTLGSRWMRMLRVVCCWPTFAGLAFVLPVSAIALLGDEGIGYVPGQRIEQPIYARVDFRVEDPAQFQANVRAAGAAVPSHYERTDPETCVTRIRNDLKELHRIAMEAPGFEEYREAMQARGWPAVQRDYQKLRDPPDPAAAAFAASVDALPIENEYVLRDPAREVRDPRSTADHVVVVTRDAAGQLQRIRVDNAHLIQLGNDRLLRTAAAELAARLVTDIVATAQGVIHATLSKHPTITYSQSLTESAIREAQQQVPKAYVPITRGALLINPQTRPGEAVITAADYELLRQHRRAYLEFLEDTTDESAAARRQLFLSQIGLITLVACLASALLVYTHMHRPRIFAVRSQTIAHVLVLLGAVALSRFLVVRWPQMPELVLAPCLVASSIMAIVHPRRFAIGTMCLVAALVAVVIRAELELFLALATAVTVLCFQLEEIRTRTRVIRAGVVTGLVVGIASGASLLIDGQLPDFVLRHVFYALGFTLLTSFVISGLVPFIERIFGVATSLSLLEWQDSRQPLLQQLAQRAPGTYNHSLVLGTLAAAGCEAIGANALLAEVAALYHDIGKIRKAEYFTENQEGRISRHEKLSPTISLLIILGHVKDGLEMAREYRLPPVLHQFILEHHGTTVVRYFHHLASEKQEQIAVGRHDREVPEAEFRYPGPKPQTRESAILMICDAVESAVRSLHEPTLGRIENLIHQLVTDRLHDGQFDECDITLKELKLVQDAVVRAVAHIYHGRIAYPKKGAPRSEAEPTEQPPALAFGGARGR